MSLDNLLNRKFTIPDYGCRCKEFKNGDVEVCDKHLKVGYGLEQKGK